MSLSALIFNAEGALAETEDVHRAAYNEAFREFGFSWVWSRSDHIGLRHVEDGAERIRTYARTTHPVFWAAFRDSGVFARIFRRKAALYSGMLADGAVALRPGVSRLIGEAMSEGIALAAVTPGTRADFRRLLTGQLGGDAAGWIGTVISSEDESSRGANPYAAALEELGVAADAAIAFESSAHGTRRAAEAGLGVVATPGIYTSSERFDDAWLVLSDLGRPAEPFDILHGPDLPHDFIGIEALLALRRAVRGGQAQRSGG
ncbi:MAG: HAD hydrolase-like protein [Paracoccaceae bacterium]